MLLITHVAVATWDANRRNALYCLSLAQCTPGMATHCLRREWHIYATAPTVVRSPSPDRQLCNTESAGVLFKFTIATMTRFSTLVMCAASALLLNEVTSVAAYPAAGYYGDQPGYSGPAYGYAPHPIIKQGTCNQIVVLHGTVWGNRFFSDIQQGCDGLCSQTLCTT